MAYFIDTNIILEILLNQKNADICEKLLNKFSESTYPIVISLFSLHSILVNLINRKKFETANDFITKLKNLRHVMIYRDEIEEQEEITKICQETGLDFDDGIQYYIALRTRCEAIISYDSDFDNLKIKRKTPDELL